MILTPAARRVVINNTIWFSLSIIFVAARIYTRRFIVHNLGWDDIFAILAIIAATATFTSHMQAVYYGVGRVFEDLTAHEMRWSLYLIWQTVLLYHLTLTLCKISIVAQYMRVFSATRFQWAFKVAMGVVAVYGCWSVLGQAFMCIPVSSFWDLGLEGKCMDRQIFWFSTSSLNIVTDILITAMPLPLIKGLKLPARAKLALIGVFVVGSIVTIASCVRLKGLYEITTSDDSTNDAVDVVIWTNIEVSLASICAAIPPLKPLLLRLFPSLKSAIGGGSSGNACTEARTLSGNPIRRPSVSATKGQEHHHQIFQVGGSGERKNSRAGSDECELVPVQSLQSKDDASDRVWYMEGITITRGGKQGIITNMDVHAEYGVLDNCY